LLPIPQVQEVFQSWRFETTKRFHSILSDTPLHLERQQLLQLEPGLPWDILHLLIELLKLPEEELFSLQAWLSKLSPEHTRVLVQLLQIESSTLLEIKRRIGPAPPTVGLAGSSGDQHRHATSPASVVLSPPSPSPAPPSNALSSSSSSSSDLYMHRANHNNNSSSSSSGGGSSDKRGKKRPADDELAIQEELNRISEEPPFAIDASQGFLLEDHDPALLSGHDISTSSPTSPLTMSSLGLSAPDDAIAADGTQRCDPPPMHSEIQQIC